MLRSENRISLKPSDIPLISVVHNEMLRLPCFLKHYRGLGITKFIFVDNNSNDGTFEYLLQQTDCHVFWSNDSYFQAGFGLTWQHYIIKTYLTDQWYIIADADELLIYPDCETQDLNVLTAYLSKYNYETMACFMLDMFNIRPSNTDCSSLLEQSPLFYNHYQHYSQVNSPYVQIGGGIRHKLFNENTASFVKTSLACAKYSIKYLSSTQITTPTKVADITSTFLHFKFIGDYETYVKNELKRKEHADSGLRYRQYLHIYDKIEKVKSTNKFTLYQNSRQLIRLGLLRSSDSWHTFVKRTDSND